MIWVKTPIMNPCTSECLIPSTLLGQG
jgi:hypothetical protein